MLSQVRGKGERESRCQLVSLGGWRTLEWSQCWWTLPYGWLKNAIPVVREGRILYFFSFLCILPTFRSNERKWTFANINIYWYPSKYLMSRISHMIFIGFLCFASLSGKDKQPIYLLKFWPWCDEASSFLISSFWSQQILPLVSNILETFFCPLSHYL